MESRRLNTLRYRATRLLGVIVRVAGVSEAARLVGTSKSHISMLVNYRRQVKSPVRAAVIVLKAYELYRLLRGSQLGDYLAANLAADAALAVDFDARYVAPLSSGVQDTIIASYVASALTLPVRASPARSRAALLAGLEADASTPSNAVAVRCIDNSSAVCVEKQSGEVAPPDREWLERLAAAEERVAAAARA